MKKKTKIFIAIGVVLVILLSIGAFILFNKKDQEKDNEKVPENKETSQVKENIDVKIMSPLLSIKDFLEDSKDLDENDFEIKYYLDDEEIKFTEKYTDIGSYKVTITNNDESYQSNIKVIDDEKPQLEVKDIEINEKETYDLKDFVVSCKDNSEKDCILSILNEEEYKEPGKYEINIEAKDDSGNSITQKANLTIKQNDEKKDNNSSTKPNTNTNKNNKGNSNTSTNKNNNKGNSNTNTNKNDKTNNNEATFVESKSEVSTTEEDFKYGIKVTKKTTTMYDLYSDGSQRNKETFTKKTYDHSGYSATTNDLLGEATSNRNTYASMVNEVLSYTNGYRSEVGAEALVLDEGLTKAAMVRALEMGYANKFSHDRPNGSSCFTVFDDLGIVSFSSGENIAWGQRSPKAAATAWRNSSGHYANMINKGFGKIGIGVFKFDGAYYWVQLFSN